MKIKTQFIGAIQNDALVAYLEDKLDGLARKYDWIQMVEVHFKTEKHPRAENCVCEIKLNVPGSVVFSSANEINFNKAINSSMRHLSAQLGKLKTRLVT